MNETIPYFGQFLSLLAALIWAFAVILFKKSGETVHPLALNLFKNLLATVLFLPTMWIFNIAIIRQVPYNTYFLLILSGILGVGISDTLFLKSLNRIGAGLSAIVDCMYSPFIIGLSVIWLKESLTILQIIGALLIISAALSTIYIKKIGKISRKDLLIGIFWGVSAMAIQAVSIVMIKPLLEQNPLLWTTEIRLLGGVVFLIFITLFYPSRHKIISSLFSTRSLGYTISGSFIGTYLTMFIWLAGMRFTQASISSVLNQTSSIFIFILATIFLKEPITLRRIIAIALALSGAIFVVLG
ncbi:DMT family transporter [candidate division WOR-3 bacterium]|nr:DMT family transporter [candidate division WOR-3 bacterium]